jgi:centromeric protein E
MDTTRRKSVDEMNKMLEEMIQDRVDNGQIFRGNRGSFRLASGQKLDSLAEPVHNLEPLRQTPTPTAVSAPGASHPDA